VKQIYDFEQHAPPTVSEHALLQEIERRRLRVQTALLALAGLLFQAAIVLLGFSAMDFYPKLSALCFGYVIVSTTGCAIIAVVYSKKGGAKL